MKTVRRVRPRLELLEDRRCPTLMIQLLPGNLVVSGVPNGTLTITETSANVFQVQDGTSNLGSYRDTGNLTLNLTNHHGKAININLNGNTPAGNLLINLGAGGLSELAAIGTGIYGGTVAGSVRPPSFVAVTPAQKKPRRARGGHAGDGVRGPSGRSGEVDQLEGRQDHLLARKLPV